jgi:hypothetical protein
MILYVKEIVNNIKFILQTRVSWMTNQAHLHKFLPCQSGTIISRQQQMNSSFQVFVYLGNEQESPMIEMVVLNSPMHDCACWIYEGHDL